MKQSFILKGNICYSASKEELICRRDSYLVCVNGISQGVFSEVPEEFKELELVDYGDALIVPGMTDLHVHAPQYTFRGTGMDLELLQWLDTYTFPEEAKYEDLDYADKAYDIFVDDLKQSATTRAVLFATRHTDATVLLMDKLEESGLKTYVGKVNMDRNSCDSLSEMTAENSLEATRNWLEAAFSKYESTKPILTPRFIPSCSDALMEGLSQFREEYHLPVQSHLSENPSEIEWVKELCPWSSCYGDAYDKFHMFGGDTNCVMAHCVYSKEEELKLLKQGNVYVAHCPQSNINLSSGIAPIRKMMDMDLLVGLGTDVAAGANLSLFRCIADAIMVSKLYWRLVDQNLKPLTFAESFYLATKGGGSFFGKVGGFEKGYELDALVLNDEKMRTARDFELKERLERYMYLAEEKGEITAKYVAGQKIF